MSEVALPTNPTRSILGNYASGCYSNTMISSRVDFHDWKSTSNYWLPTKGGILNACVGGFGDQAISLEVCGMGS